MVARKEKVDRVYEAKKDDELPGVKYHRYARTLRQKLGVVFHNGATIEARSQRSSTVLSGRGQGSALTSVRSIDEGSIPLDGLFKGNGSSCDEHHRGRSRRRAEPAMPAPVPPAKRGRKLEHEAHLVKGTLSLL